MVLEGKVAIVTGGATGIGRSTALELAKHGAAVTINYSRSSGEAEDTIEQIKTLGGKAIMLRADVSKDEEARQIVTSTIEHFGRLDILVNNAGTTNFVDFNDLEGLSEEYWDRAMGVNVKGVFFCCRAAAPYLKQNRGCIINVTSVAGITGLGSSIAYCASKAAAISVTKSLARVLAPEVRVNSVAPGVVLTRWVDGQEEHIERLGKGTPLQRVCEADDVSEVIMSLITSGSMITGQTIVVDGGMFIR